MSKKKGQIGLEHSRDIEGLDVSGPMYQEMMYGTDRVTAILAGCYLDECLDGFFKKVFVHDKECMKALFDLQNAPLSSFFNKIHFAFALGLLPQKHFHDLNVIRDICNAFAHWILTADDASTFSKLSFQSKKISEKCDKLRTPYPREILGGPEDLVISKNKERFLLAVFQIGGFIRWETTVINPRRMQNYAPNTPPLIKLAHLPTD